MEADIIHVFRKVKEMEADNPEADAIHINKYVIRQVKETEADNPEAGIMGRM